MKYTLIIVLLLCRATNQSAIAGEYSESLKGIALSKNLVIHRDHTKDKQGNVIPKLEAEICRLNHWPPPSARIASAGNCIAWWYYGSILSLQDAKQNSQMVLLLTPENYFDENGYSSGARLPFGRHDDYFIVPMKNPENIHVASVPKSLWFVDFKKELLDYQSEVERVESLPDEERLSEIMKLATAWNDIRSLAMLERLLERKDAKLSEIVSMIYVKSDAYQFKSAQILLMTTSLSKESRFSIFNPKGDPAWHDGPKHLKKLLDYLLPPTSRLEAVAIINQYK